MRPPAHTGGERGKAMDEKLKALADKITAERLEYMINFSKGYVDGADAVMALHGESSIIATVRPGKKYTKIDVGSSGKYMVDNATGEIFGIKAYGVINRGHRYGTLDTINNWHWGGYDAVRKAA